MLPYRQVDKKPSDDKIELRMKKIMTADIGGTNSRFAFFSLAVNDELELAEVKWLKTGESTSFSHLIMRLMESGFSLKPEDSAIAVFAVAGPVEDGRRSSPPFILWDIDIDRVCKEFPFRRCHVINDFVAQAYACRSPVGLSAEQILPGIVNRNAAMAVIGAGTGLGKAAIIPTGKDTFVAVPSEGGHANFSFQSARELAYQDFLLNKLSERYITGNRVVSGSGLSAVHEFLTGEILEPDRVAALLPQSPETLEWAARFFGRACRNYALEVVAVGGIYVAGGLAAKIPALLTHESFKTEFRSSDTLHHILEKIPVSLMRDENSGLWGGAVFGRQLLLSS